MMADAFVGVGSNIDPEKNVREAVGLLTRRVSVRAVSTVYRTNPERRPDQPRFLNCVVLIETDIPPLALKFRVFRPIEKKLLRVRNADKFSPRTIDLDLLLYDDIVLKTGALTLPDPDITERPYLAIPLAELRPGLVVPGMKVTIGVFSAAIPHTGMEPLAEYTASLQEMIKPVGQAGPR
jgi:2-amino-4-hydroxy-6-hydroxymethyldihydropteridine diphosphokinase